MSAAIREFEMFNLDTGRTIGYADTVQDVVEMAQENRMQPALAFMAIDSDGYQVGTWALGEVLNGGFEAEMVSYH